MSHGGPGWTSGRPWTRTATISDPARQPIALGLFRAYISYTQVEWGFLAALSVIYVIPAVVFYVVARRALQQSVAGGLAGT
jgi:multiple sugar transport system permease protein